MDWQNRMGRALDYLEKHLREEIDYEAAARKANCSLFHFMRIFQIVTDISPAEYVRRRRLSLAATDLAAGDERVIDVALRYGYESPDSFGRAFKREFGFMPSEAREPGRVLHAYTPLAFTVVLKGAKPMEYRIEKGPEYRLTGLSIPVSSVDGCNFVTIPAFWDEIMSDGRFGKLLEAGSGSSVGLCGVCRNFDMKAGTFIYSAAIETPADRSPLPPGCDEFTVPATTWAKFTARGPLRPNLQETVKRIFGEWFPNSGREHAGTAEIEYYPDLDPGSQDYWCEYWVPLK